MPRRSLPVFELDHHGETVLTPVQYGVRIASFGRPAESLKISTNEKVTFYMESRRICIWAIWGFENDWSNCQSDPGNAPDHLASLPNVADKKWNKTENWSCPVMICTRTWTEAKTIHKELHGRQSGWLERWSGNNTHLLSLALIWMPHGKALIYILKVYWKDYYVEMETWWCVRHTETDGNRLFKSQMDLPWHRWLLGWNADAYCQSHCSIGKQREEQTRYPAECRLLSSEEPAKWIYHPSTLCIEAKFSQSEINTSLPGSVYYNFVRTFDPKLWVQDMGQTGMTGLLARHPLSEHFNNGDLVLILLNSKWKH